MFGGSVRAVAVATTLGASALIVSAVPAQAAPSIPAHSSVVDTYYNNAAKTGPVVGTYTWGVCLPSGQTGIETAYWTAKVYYC